MTACQSVQERLSAYLDEELDATESAEVESHLERCRLCRNVLEELKESQRLLCDHFSRLIDRAPVPPGIVKESARQWNSSGETERKKGGIMFKAAAAIIAALVVTVSVYIFPSKPSDASAAELIKLASQNYLNLEDVEVWVTPTSEALNLLETIFEISEKEKKKPEEHGIPPFRILLKAPNRFLVQFDAGPDPWKIADNLAGFDGENGWVYDKEKKQVFIQKSPKFEFNWGKNDGMSTTFDIGEQDLMKFLSWDFVERLYQEHDKYGVVEKTGPFARRIGRRVFEIINREPEEKEEAYETREESYEEREGESTLEKFFWSKAFITIDPEEGLIEKFDLDINFGGLSLLRMKVEVDRVNTGVAPAFFRYSHHVPKGTEVVEKEEEKEKEEKQ